MDVATGYEKGTAKIQYLYLTYFQKYSGHQNKKLLDNFLLSVLCHMSPVPFLPIYIALAAMKVQGGLVSSCGMLSDRQSKSDLQKNALLISAILGIPSLT